MQRLLPGLAGLVLLGLAGLVVPAGQAGEITGSGGGLSLGTRVNGQMGGSCGAGDCGISGGTKAGPNLFHRFASFDTRGGIRSVLFDTQGQRTLVVGVVNPLGSFLDKPIGFSSPASLIWLSPGGVHLGGGVGFVNIPSLQLSTATGLRVGGGMFDVMRTTAAQAAQLSGEPLAGRAGLVSDPASLAAASLSANGDVTLSSGLLTVDHELLLDAQGGHVLLQGGQIRVPGGSVELAGKSVTVAPPAGVSVGGASGRGTIRAQAGSGGLEVAGSLEARTEAPAAAGGRIELSGSTVALRGARLEASGPAGGGTVLVGGGLQGGDAAVANAQATLVDGASTIRADATAAGRGGTVVVWADRATRVDGAISARGGVAGGDGGFVETSGRQQLAVSQAPDASAPWGKGGTWLLDPNNLTVNATGPDFNISGANIGFIADYFTSGDNAVIATTTITSALNAGTSVFLSTSAGGLQAGDITVAAPITKAEGLDSIPTLTLVAHNNININADITSTAGQLGLTLTPDSDATGSGVSTLASGVTLDLNGGTALLNGTSSLAGTVSVGTLSATGGNTTLESSGTLTAAQINLTGGTLTANGPLTTKTYTQSGGTLGGTGDVTVTGGSTLSGGSLSGAGVFITASSTALSGVITLDGKTWTNLSFGDLPVTQSVEAQVVLTNGSTINNQGSWNIEGSNPTPITSGNFSNVFNNSGTLTKAVGSVASATLNLDGSFNNSGVVNVNEGTLQLNNFPTNSGALNIASGAALSTNGNNLTNAATTGVIRGEGTLNLGSGTLANAGTISPGTPSLSPGLPGTAGTLTINGNLALEPTSLLEIDLLGSGTFPLANDQLVVNGQVSLGGTLTASTGSFYTPPDGTTADILTIFSGSTGVLSGSFATTNLPAGFSGTTVTPPAPASPTYRISKAPCPGVCWDGGGGDNLWSTATNWTLDTLPGLSDTTYLNLAGGASVLLNDTRTIAALFSDIGNNLAIINGGSLTVTGAATASDLQGELTIAGGNLTLDGLGSTLNVFRFGTSSPGIPPGTLGGSGTVTVTGGSSLSGGTLSGAGAFITDSATTVSGSIAVQKPWTNAATRTLSQTGSAQVFVGLSDTITNAGIWNLDGTAATPITSNFGPGAFTNAAGGTLNKNTASEVTLNPSAGFNNNGTLNVVGGGLTIPIGGTDSGTYNVASGTTLNLSSGTRSVTASGNITGAGSLNISGAIVNYAGTVFGLGTNININGGTFNINSDQTLANPFTLSSGTLGGSGTVTVTGGSSLSGGTLSGAGAFITDSATTVSGSIAVQKPWTNAATRTLSQTGSAQVFVGLSDTITNAGIWNLDGTAATPITSNFGPGAFTNAAGGTLNKNTASEVTLNPSAGFNNNGTLNVNSGGLLVGSSFAQAGTIAVAAGASFEKFGGFSNAPGGVIEGAGVVSVGFGNTLTNAGTISPGTPSLSPGIPGTVGTLTINGDLALTSTSQLFIDLEGGEGAFDKLVVNGNASLGGTLTASLAPGYTPPVGSTFDIVTATSFSGGSTSLPSGSFTTTNLPTDFSGTTVTPPSPANPTYRLSKGAPCAGVCWDGGGGDNLWSTATNWTLDTLPGLSDTAYLNLLGGASVLLDNAQTIAALFSDAGNNLTIASGGSLTLLGTGSGDSRLDGSLTLQAGSSLSLNGTGLQAVQGLLNEGLVVINSHQSPSQGDAYIRIPSGQTFENRGSLDLNFTQTFGGWSLLSNPEGQDGIFTNSGRVTLNSGSSAWEIAFNNTAAGQVTLASNSVLSVQNGQTLAGSFQLGAGSTLWFSERHGADATFQAATIQGPGVIQVLGSFFSPRARVDAATQFQSATDQAAGLPGLLLGSGGSVLLDGAARWSTYSQSGGFLGGSGTLEVLRSYERSGGSVAPTLAAVTINQASGDLRVADLDVAGPLSLTAEAGSLNLAGFLAADRIQAFGTTGLSLESGTVLEATSPSGVAMVLQAGSGAFANQAGSTALSVAEGATWQVYSASPLTPEENLGSLGYNFKQYGKSFADATPVEGSGNGLFYAFIPILEASLSGSTSKVFDGSLTAVVDPAQVKFSGVLPGDAVSLGATGPAFYDSRDVGSSKLVTLTGVGVLTASEGSIPVYGYQVFQVDGGRAPIGVITPATVFGGFNAADKTFDGGTTATILNRLLSGAVPGDQVALVGGSASFITPDVGTIKPVFGTGFQLAGVDRGNYTLFESGLITVASILAAPPPPPPPTPTPTPPSISTPTPTPPSISTPTPKLPPTYPIFAVRRVDPLPEEIVGGSPDRSPFPEAGLGRSILNLSSASDLGWLFNGSDLPEPEPAARARAGAAAAPAALPGASSMVLDLADPAEAYSNAERKAPAIAEQLGLGRQKEAQAAPPSSLSLQEWMQRNKAAVRQGAVTP